MTTRARLWLPVVAWCALLFGLSSIPGAAIPKVSIPQLDKLVHATLYGGLGALVARASWPRTARSRARTVVGAGLFAVAYGITDELHQLFVPRRSSDVLDVAADAVGGFLGAWLATKWLIAIDRRGKSKAAL
ncbi:MAG TPA: VanZ family protein [Polyangia bacterium]|nr:VanZ family protein [Polyangia bacterium]